MTIYRYDTTSLIDEVRIVKNASGGHRAYLHARSTATPEQLTEIQQRLLGNGYKTIPCCEKGLPVLEVRGLKGDDTFLNYLSSHAWIQGEPQILKQRDDVVSPRERLNNLTLKGTGLVYNAGDAAYITYTLFDYKHDKKILSELVQAGASAEKIAAAKGAVSGSKLGIGGGIGYALGGLVLTFFASKDQSQNEIKSGVKKVRNFMIKEGADVPSDTASYEITKKEDKSLPAKVSDFLKKNPSEVLNSIYTGVGILLAVSSLKKVDALKVAGKSLFAAENQHALNEAKDVGLGAITMTSSLIGLFVKEKKREPDEPRETGIRGVWQWIQEKPLRATGVGLGISTLFHGWATIGKYQAGDQGVRKTVMFRAVFVAANILAEALMFVSSKGHGQGVKTDESVENSVIACTAELISKQSPGYQNQLVEQLAGYMASPDILGGKAEIIASQLHTQLAMISQHPWVKHVQAAVPAPALASAKSNAADAKIDADPTSPPLTTIAAHTIDQASRVNSLASTHAVGI